MCFKNRLAFKKEIFLLKNVKSSNRTFLKILNYYLPKV